MDRIQFRRDYLAQWRKINPVLLEGELGLVLDEPNKYKVGDGINAWNNLPLRGFNGNVANNVGDSEDSVISQKFASSLASTFDVSSSLPAREHKYYSSAWRRVSRDTSAGEYDAPSTYQIGDKCNMPDDSTYSYEALEVVTGVPPYTKATDNKYNLSEAIAALPSILRRQGIHVGFIDYNNEFQIWESINSSFTSTAGWQQSDGKHFNKKFSELEQNTDTKIHELKKEVSQENSSSKHDFSISDEKGNNVVVFDKGHVKTKNFDSENAPYKGGGRHEFSISDEEDNNLVTFNRGHIRTKDFNSENTPYEDLSKHDFSISDEKGNNVVVFDKGHVKTKNFDSEKLDDKFDNIESLIANISGTVLSNSMELSVTWNKGMYLQEDGNVETTIVEGGQVSDFITYTDGMAIIGGFVKQAQNYVLACLYDANKNKIGAIYATKDVQEEATNMECWQYLNASQDNLDEGYTLDDVKLIKVQSKESYIPKIYNLTGFDRLVNNTYGFKDKKIAFFGGSYSSIDTGICFKGYLRLKLGTFVRTFGLGGAGFGINSCWPKGYPDPELQDGKLIWEDSVPKQIDKAIQYCVDNDITDGFDYWILWASTNDFNTHIKGKGEINYTLDQLQDTTQFGNADTQDGGIILSINKIRQAYPKAKILFFGSLPFFSKTYGYNLDDTTKPSSNVWLVNGTREQRTQTNTFKEFIDDQKAICEKYHIPYLDQMGLANIDEWNYEEFYNPGDGYLHPLRQGFLRWINFQTNFIMNN